MAPSRRLPQMSALRAFEATVRHESVSHAARELNLTDGAVSRAVRELEVEFGANLFRRGNRLIVPTATARTLAADIRSALDELVASFARARRQASPTRSLTLSCEPTFLIRWLIPRLASFQEIVGPENEVRLVSAGGPVAFKREGVDLAIRRADFPIADDVVAEPFMNEAIGPVCRPEIAGRIAPATSVDGTILHTSTRPNAWSRWSELSGIRVGPGRELTFEHFYQSLQGAVAGAGLAIGPIALVADDLEAGVLKAPLGFIEDGTRYVLMQSRSDGDSDLYQAVLEWLKMATETLDVHLTASAIT